MKIAMATPNHTNLTTYNVPALAEFFCSVFGFERIDKRGDKLAVLRDTDGFLLTRMYHKQMTPEQGYPGLFHVGIRCRSSAPGLIRHQNDVERDASNWLLMGIDP